MVVFSERARADLESIFDGLSAWKTPNGQFYMTNEQIVDYHNDILDVCERIDRLPFHFKAIYETHTQYGEYVCQYKRSNATSWYIIYNIDNQKNFYINKIINNHLTTN